MNRLDVYERSLTLFGEIFSTFKSRKQRYFLASIKTDLVYFFFALQCNQVDRQRGDRIGDHFFPRNFNEWRFNKLTMSGVKNDSSLWDVDQVYFRDDMVSRRAGKRVVALSGGLDLGRFYTLEEFKAAEPDGVLLDWRTRPLYFISLLYTLSNIVVLLQVLRLLRVKTTTNLSLLKFMQYFLYYAYHSARVRAALEHNARDNTIGRALFSDIDNAWGNSFMLWSHYYGFTQEVYPHGSSLYHNRRRYFEPDIYHVYTTHHERVIQELSLRSRVVRLLPRWAARGIPAPTTKNSIKNVLFVTGMEKNIAIPLGDKDLLLTYADQMCTYAQKTGWQVSIKSHKLLDWHEEYRALESRYPNVRHVEERWNLDKLASVDVAVLATTESSIALQLLAMGIPTITLREVIEGVWTKHCSAPLLGNIVASKYELFEALTMWTSNSEQYRVAQNEARILFHSLVPSLPKH